VRAQIVDAVKKEQGTAAAVKAAEAARQKLAGGASIDDVAKELGVTAEPARFVGRSDPAVPAQIRDAVFSAAKPEPNKPVVRAVPLATGGSSIVVATESRVNSGDTTPQMQTSLRRQIAARQGMGDVGAYVAELRRTAKVVKNPQAFEQ
jgi:hypothetical protein